MATTDATPVPIKGVAYRVYFPIFDSTGEMKSAAGSIAAKISKDAVTAVATTNTPTEIATATGAYYLDLTATEMTADCVFLKITSTSGKSVPIVLYPNQAGDIDVDVLSWNGTAVATPDTAGYPKVTSKSGTGAGELSLSAGVVQSDVAKINGNAADAVTLQISLHTMVRGTVDNTALVATSTLFQSDDVTEGTASHFVGRSVYPTSGVLLFQSIGVITAYSLVGGRGQFTIFGSPSNEAMADNTTFIIA
jgi:hypothetical protein